MEHFLRSVFLTHLSPQPFVDSHKLSLVPSSVMTTVFEKDGRKTSGNRSQDEVQNVH